MIPVAKRLELVGEYYFSRKLDEIRSMQAAGTDVINLGIGSPDLSPSEETLKATVEALHSEKAHGYQSYRSIPELRKAMADFYQRTYGVSASPATEILPLLGSKEGIMYVSMAFLNPGDGVLVPNPGYPAYAAVANLLGARLVNYDITEKTGWLPDFNAMEKQDLQGVKLMWVNYPNMPTGKNASERLFSDLVAFGKKHGILICNDNPYSLVLTPKPLSILSQDPKKEHSIELNSLSKSFNMAGWRVGMLVGGEECVNAVLQVKSNVDTGMFYPIQKGAEAAFRNSSKWHDQRNEAYAQRRRVAEKIFSHLGFEFEKDQVGMFLWARAPQSVLDVENFLNEILHTRHVFITPGFIFGSNGNRYGRVSLCQPAAVLESALQRMQGEPRTGDGR